MDDIHTKHGHPEDENPAVSYERGDIDIFAVTKFGIGLAIATIVVVFLMWGLFDWFHKHTHEEVEQLPQSVIDARKGVRPPEPRLQTMGDPAHPDVQSGALRSPHVELQQFRKAEALQLNSYAWVDPNKGIVRIPIDEAKDLVLKKGLPSKVTPDGQAVAMTPNPAQGVGTPAAAQPQRVYATGAAAIGSSPVTELPKTEVGEKK